MDPSLMPIRRVQEWKLNNVNLERLILISEIFFLMKVYGIKNCDTVKKALKWLESNNIDYDFHDFKKSGISAEKLKEWSAKLGWEPLINKRGTTWKKLDAETQNRITNENEAFELMQEKTSVIKRPVIENDQDILIGFDENMYQQTLA